MRADAAWEGDRFAILIADQEGKPLACSEAFGQLFGSPDRLRMRDAGGQELALASWPQTSRQHGDVFCSALTLQLADGTSRLFSVSCYPLVSAAGPAAPQTAVWTFEEQPTADHLAEVAALVSHELRTPLTVLHAALQLLRRSLPPGEPGEAARYADQALAEARQLNVLTGQLLEATRLQAGRLRLHPEPLSLPAIVRDICRRAQTLARGQRIEVSLPDGEVVVRADRARLEQMLMNLLVNAITYAPETSRIDVRVWRQDGQAAVEVRDYGAGIKAQRLARLSEPFYQAPRQDRPSRGGLGLGLYLCRELARLHGGRLAISSQEGSGAIFVLWLPALAAQPQESTAERVREDVGAMPHSVS